MPVNYPQRGSIGQQRRIYREGESFEHESGVVYRLTAGVWTVVWRPGDPEPKPEVSTP